MNDGRKTLDWRTFEELASQARREPAPCIDVTAEVLQTVRARSQRVSRIDAPLLLLAGAALAAALLLTMFALPAWDSMHDPLVFQLRSLTQVMK
jgi:hypothetical protein